MPPTPTTIPTSFVPKQPVRPGSQFSKSGGNTYLYVAFVILGVAVLASAGVLAYEHFLNSVRDAKAEQVQIAQSQINTDTVEEFIRTRNRFSAAGELLENHVAASNFFTLLETLTLQNVRFDTLSFELTDERFAEIRMDGVARTFNALAAQSSAFAEEKRIKRAIFSDIAVDKGGTVTFALSAELDPRLLAFVKEPPPIEPALPSEESAIPAPLEAEPEETATTSPAL